MTVLSKSPFYIFEGHGGLCFEFYHNDRQQTAVVHPENVPHTWLLENMQFHRVPHFYTCFFSYTSIWQITVKTDIHLLILQTTENRVSRTNEQQSGLQLCQLSQVNKWFKVNKLTSDVAKQIP